LLEYHFFYGVLNSFANEQCVLRNTDYYNVILKKLHFLGIFTILQFFGAFKSHPYTYIQVIITYTFFI